MNIRELQQTELIIAPSIKTEGKVFQRAASTARRTCAAEGRAGVA